MTTSQPFRLNRDVSAPQETASSRYPLLVPLAWYCSGLVLATLIGPYLPSRTVFPFSAALALTAFICVLYSLGRGLTIGSSIIGGIMMLLLAVLLGSQEFHRGSGFVPPEDEVGIMAEVVRKLSSEHDRRVFLVGNGTLTATGRSLPGFGRVSLRDNELTLHRGDRIAFHSYVRIPANRGNPGEFDWELHCRSRKICWLASVQGHESVLIVRRGVRRRPMAMLHALRENMGHFLETRASPASRPVLKALLLGDRGEITTSLHQAFAGSGLIHMLSPSGLHVGIVALFASLFVRALTYPVPQVYCMAPFKKLAAAASLLAIVAYAVVVGPRIPVTRAAIMGTVVAVAILCDRQWVSLNSVALAALIILLIHPLSLFTPSFQLSFAAVTGILVLMPGLLTILQTPGLVPESQSVSRPATSRLGRLRTSLKATSRFWIGLLAVPVVAQISVLPFLVIHFRSLPLGSLPANLASAIPLMAALPFGMVAAVLGCWSPEAGAVVLQPADMLINWIITVATTYSELFGSVHVVPTTLVAALGLALSIVAAALFFRQQLRAGKPWIRSGIAAAIILAALLSLAVSADPSRRLSVIFFNVGRADAVLVQPPGCPPLLIDGGVRTPYFDSGASIIVPALSWMGVTELNSVVISHPQVDHMGGLPAVLRATPVSALWLNDVGAGGHLLKEVLSCAQKHGAMIRPANRMVNGPKCGAVQFRFLNMPGCAARPCDTTHDLNNSSVVVRMDYGNVSFLFTGDLEAPAERALLRSGAHLAATVLKVCHHGCGSSSTPAFLDAVQPAVGVIPSFCFPGARCPTPEVLQRLRERNIKTYWTGRDGAVTVRTDGSRLEVSAARAPDRFVVVPAAAAP
jgi:competence protein ComEC